MVEWVIEAAVQGKKVAATAVGIFNISPKQVWDILTVPDGADIFRVEGRRLLSDDGMGTWEEQVVFTAPVRILFWKPTTRSRVHQRIDASDPGRITVQFMLLQSDLMSHLSGQWILEQLPPSAAAGSPMTRVTYSFQMWPKGVPTALRFMPGLLDAVKGAVKREAAQLLDKVYYVAQKVEAGLSVVDALRAATAEIQLSGGSFKLLMQALQSSKPPPSTFCPSTPATASASADVVACHALAMDEDSDEHLDEDLELNQLSTDDEACDEITGSSSTSCDDLVDHDGSSSSDESAVAVSAVIHAVEVVDAAGGSKGDCSKHVSRTSSKVGAVGIVLDAAPKAYIVLDGDGQTQSCSAFGQIPANRDIAGSRDDSGSQWPASIEAHEAPLVECNSSSSNSNSMTAADSLASADIDADVMIDSCPGLLLDTATKQQARCPTTAVAAGKTADA